MTWPDGYSPSGQFFVWGAGDFCGGDFAQISFEMSCVSLTFWRICAIIYYRNDVLAVTAYMMV